MKAYKQDLATFYSSKEKEDLKFKNKIGKRKTFEEKRKYIEEYRHNVKLETGTFSIFSNNSPQEFERKEYIRDFLYLETLNIDLKNRCNEFNQFKYDVLYELIDLSEEEYSFQFDNFAREISEIHELIATYINKKKSKQDKITANKKKIELQIKERLDEFKESSLEEKLEIYKQTIDLRKELFKIIEPNICMIQSDEFILVTDYLPVKHNQKQIIKNPLEPVEELVPEELEPEELNLGNLGAEETKDS